MLDKIFSMIDDFAPERVRATHIGAMESGIESISRRLGRADSRLADARRDPDRSRLRESGAALREPAGAGS